MIDSRSIRAAATGQKEQNAYETSSRSSDNNGTFITDRARFVELSVHVFFESVVEGTLFRIGRYDGGGHGWPARIQTAYTNRP
jgi:hypothetical protein